MGASSLDGAGGACAFGPSFRRYSALSLDEPKSKRTWLHKMAATFPSAITATLLGHPPDTVVKYLQANPLKPGQGLHAFMKKSTAVTPLEILSAKLNYCRHVRFAHFFTSPNGGSISSVGGVLARFYRGGAVAFFCYKGPQTALKMGMLHDVRQAVGDLLYADEDPKYYSGKQRLIVNGVSGNILGTMEAVFLYPADVLKKHFQLAGQFSSFIRIVKNQPSVFESLQSIYPGFQSILIRNAVLGTPSLLLGNECGKLLFGIRETDGTLTTYFMTSAMGSILSIVVPYPLDTYATFLSRPDRPESGSIFQFIRRYSLSQMYNGLGMKLCSTVPKQAAGFAVFQMIIGSTLVAEKCDSISFRLGF